MHHLQPSILLMNFAGLNNDVGILETVSRVAGIGGVAIGALLLIFRDVIRKNIFPSLAKADAYRLLRLIIFASWSVALVGIAAWVYTNSLGNPSPEGLKEYQLSGMVRGPHSVIPDVEISVVGGAERTVTTTSGRFLMTLKREKAEPVRIQAIRQGYKLWNDEIPIPNDQLIIQLEPLDDANANSNGQSKPTPSRGANPTRKRDNANQSPVIIHQQVTTPTP